MDARARTVERVLPAVLGLATVLAYLPGSSRAFGYDEAVTVHYFIRAPFGASLQLQYGFNNHQYLSFLDQVFAELVGSTSETTLRVLPICFAGAAVALVTHAVARRWGWRAGACAGIVLATNPMFLTESREVRGYSLLVLCAVASTIIASRPSPASGWERWAYVLAIGIGLGTHVFMAWVVLAHVVMHLVRRDDRAEWVFRWIAGGLIGSVPYLITLGQVGRHRQADFRLGFPAEVARDVFGTEPVTIAVVAGLCAFGAWQVRSAPLALPLGALGVASVLITWFAPAYVGSRFFVWAVPAVALGVALAVHHRPAVAVLLLPAAVFAVVPIARTYTSDELANRRMVPIVLAARDRGQEVCGLGASTETLQVYVGDMPMTVRPERLRRCDVVVVVVPRFEPELLEDIRPSFPHVEVIPARTPGLVLTKQPLD